MKQMLENRKQIDQKAEAWFAVSSLTAATSISSLDDKFPSLMSITSRPAAMQMWPFVISVAATGAAAMSAIFNLSATNSDEHIASLICCLNRKYEDGSSRCDHLMSFVNDMVERGIALDSALGFWVLAELKGSRPTDAELESAAPIGRFLVHLSHEWWK